MVLSLFDGTVVDQKFSSMGKDHYWSISPASIRNSQRRKDHSGKPLANYLISKLELTPNNSATTAYMLCETPRPTFGVSETASLSASSGRGESHGTFKGSRRSWPSNITTKSLAPQRWEIDCFPWSAAEKLCATSFIPEEYPCAAAWATVLPMDFAGRQKSNWSDSIWYARFIVYEMH